MSQKVEPPMQTMKTYGRHRATPTFGTGNTYVPVVVNSPDDDIVWGPSQSSSSSRTTKSNPLNDLNHNDLNKKNEAKMSTKDKQGVKRPRCNDSAVSRGHCDDVNLLSKSLLECRENPTKFSGTIFVIVPPIWPAERYTTWLEQLGFVQIYLGTQPGYSYCKVEVNPKSKLK
jgi:hypothetical protein